MMAKVAESIGVVLIAHGSRVAEANRDLVELAARFRERGYSNTVASYLELAEPDIVAGGEQCAAAGAGVIVLTPYFLSAGRHVRDDLEAARVELQRRLPHCRFLLAQQLGPHALLETILEERIESCLALNE